MKGIGEKIQPTAVYHLRVELSQGSRRRIAGIGEFCVSVLLAFSINRCKRLQTQKGFAANFNSRGWIFTLQSQRNRADGADVWRNLLASDAIPSGGSPRQDAVFVGQSQGGTVDFQFADIVKVIDIWSNSLPSLFPFCELVGVEGVVETVEGDVVLD